MLQAEKTFLAIVLHILVLYSMHLTMSLHKLQYMPYYRDQF